MFLFEGHHEEVGVGGRNGNSSMNELSNSFLDIFEQLHFVWMFSFLNFIWRLKTLWFYVENLFYVNDFNHFTNLCWKNIIFWNCVWLFIKRVMQIRFNPLTCEPIYFNGLYGLRFPIRNPPTRQHIGVGFSLCLCFLTRQPFNPNLTRLSGIEMTLINGWI